MNLFEQHITRKIEKLEHYTARSREWFYFLLEHPQFRTRHIICKLYGNYMLSVGHTKILLDNLEK